jgi:hypothetical protein
VVAPDLAAVSASGQATASGYLLKGTVRNNGPGAYTGGRTVRFEKRTGTTWVALTATQALPGTIAAGATAPPVQATLPTAPAAATQVRLRISGGDAQPANDVSTPFTVVLPDLRAQNATGVQLATSYKLSGQVVNNGPGVYAGTRKFSFQKWNGSSWVALTAEVVIPGGALAVGGTRPVSGTVTGTLPKGTPVRLHLTPGDAVVSNDNSSPFFVQVADLQALSAAHGASVLTGSIRNNGPGFYVGGRSFRFEKKVGGSWVALTGFHPVPGAGTLAAGSTHAVSVPFTGSLPPGTPIRLHLSPGDANTGNDDSQH